MSFGIPVNSATATMEEIYELLCWLYTTVQNTFVYDHSGGPYYPSDLTELSEGKILYLEQFADKPDYEQVAKSLQAKTYIVSSLAQVCVRVLHMEKGVSQAGAGLGTLTTWRPARVCGERRGPAGVARRGGEERL